MGYDLSNCHGQTHQWKVLGWWQLLNLAREYGWSPLGTEPPPPSGAVWDGNYFRNEGQQVTAGDAMALADALERLLAAPNREITAAAVAAQMAQIVTDTAIESSSDGRDVLRYPVGFIRQMLAHFGQESIGNWRFGGRADEYLRQFIDFCRAGPFRIE